MGTAPDQWSGRTSPMSSSCSCPCPCLCSWSCSLSCCCSCGCPCSCSGFSSSLALSACGCDSSTWCDESWSSILGGWIASDEKATSSSSRSLSSESEASDLTVLLLSGGECKNCGCCWSCILPGSAPSAPTWTGSRWIAAGCAAAEPASRCEATTASVAMT